MNKKVKVITRRVLVNLVAKEVGVTKALTSEILEGLETVVYQKLGTANEEEDIEIKLFHGLFLDSEYIAEHEGRDPRDNSKLMIAPKRRARCKIGKDLKRGINEINIKDDEEI